MANRQQIGVNLSFTADIQQAKKQIENLQNSLTKLMNSSAISDPTLGFSKEIQEAITLTAQLKTNLANATNVNTGRLDLSKFNDSLKRSNVTLKDYQTALSALGSQGTEAFSALASSILQAEIPLKRTSTVLDGFAVTLKNTAKWQISSNIMHGLEGALKKAYGYAQDLNKSLNDIRIVTEYDAEKMADFAVQANKAAKELSTTTNEYAKASLIYYQQGLAEDQIAQRTNTTVKMANVTGESAEQVSDYMTAVWNNFDNGSKSLEYYADVMTALGAATASSTDEIAQGLEKFAAVSETVGLSYEYATSALATVTATTRQSADIVGTAFKTLFSRIQGLELGETLDDGTTLNKYSQALMKVGISIKESNGDLKAMDDILNEMGAVWETLNKSEQTALAQKVAGVRQYNQLIALMENWDTFQENLQTAVGAKGTLQEQADIYAESWEASKDRVTAAAESIYDTLIDENFFIGLNNILESLLNGVNKLMGAMGGLPGILTLIGSVATSVLHKQLAQGIDNLIYSIKINTKTGREELEKIKSEASELLIAEWTDQDTLSGRIAGDAYREQGKAQAILLANAEKLSAEEQQQVQFLLDQHNVLVQQLVKNGQIIEIEKNKTKMLERRIQAQVELAAKESIANNQQKQSAEDLTSKYNLAQQQLSNIQKLYYNISTVKLTGNQEADEANLKRLSEMISKIRDKYQDAKDWSPLNNRGLANDYGNQGASALIKIEKLLKAGKISAKELDDALFSLDKSGLISVKKLEKALNDCGIEGEEAERIAQKLKEQYETLGDATANVTEEQEKLKNSTKNVSNYVEQAKGHITTFGDVFTATANSISSFGFALSAIKGIVDTLNNTEMTFGEKFFSILTSLSMIVPSVISSVSTLVQTWQKFNKAEALNSLTKGVNAVATWMAAKAEKDLRKERDKTSASTVFNTDVTEDNSKAKLLGDGSSQTPLLEDEVVQTTLRVALNNLKGSLLKLLTKIGPWAIAIAAIGTTLVIGSEIWNEEAKAVERAAESAEAVSKGYEQAKQNYSDLTATMSNYQSAVDGLEKMISGTVEFKDAVIQANNEAMKLIETYDLLYGEDYSIDDDSGLIQINEDSIKNIQEKQLSEMQKNQQALLISQQRAKQIQTQSNMTEFYRNNQSFDDESKQDQLSAAIAGGVSAAIAGAKIGSAIGSAINVGAGTAVGAVIGGVAGIVGGYLTTDFVENNNTNQALNSLAEVYEKEGIASFANLETTLSELKITDPEIVNALTEDKDATLKLVQEMVANTEANKALNKSIVNSEYKEDISNLGLNSGQSNFLTTVLGDKLETTTQKLFEDEYSKSSSSRWWKAWEEESIQRQYAEAMGYDSDNIDDKIGEAIYYDKDGNEIGTIEDDVARKYLAEQDALKKLGETLDEEADKVSKLTQKEKELSQQHGQSTNNYQTYIDELIKAGVELGFSQEQIEEYAANYGSNIAAGQRVALAKNLSNYDQFANEEQAKAFVDTFTKGFTDEQLKIALQVSADSEALDEFKRDLETSIIDSFSSGIQTSLEKIPSILEDNKISNEDISILGDDENFIEYLKTKNKELVDVTNATYTERLAIVNDFYIQLKALENESLNDGINNYKEDLAEYEAIYQYKLAQEKGLSDDIEKIKETYSYINFEDYEDETLLSISGQIDEIQSKIDELNNKQIEISVNWDGVSQIEGTMEKLSTFAAMMSEDATQIGNSYQLTAQQAREWMEVYPELFSQASVTTDGLISLDKTVVDNYINGQEAELDANIETQIKSLEIEKEELKAKQEIVKADLKLAQTKAMGEMQLESASTEYLVDLRQQLVEYFMEQGKTQIEANTEALKTMGLNQVTYTKLVKDSSDANSENMTNSFTSMASIAKVVFEEIGKAWKAFISGESYVIDWDRITAVSQPSETIDINDYNFSTGIDQVYKDLETSLTNELNAIDKQIESIDSQITYLQAIGDSPIKDFKDGTDKSSSKSKDKEVSAGERYHEVNEELDDMERKLDQVSKKKDKAFGAQKIAYMNQELKLLNDTLDLQKDKIAEVEKNLSRDQAVLNQYGAKYDKEGRITNYDEMVATETVKYNQAINSGNEKTIELAEKRYEDFKKSLEQYEETLNLLEEEEQNLQNYVDEKAELKLAKIQYTLEIGLELNEQDMKMIEYQLQKLENKAFSQAEKIILYQQQTSILTDNAKLYEDQATSILKSKGLNKKEREAVLNGDYSSLEGVEFTQEEISALQTSLNGLMETNQSLYETNELIRNQLPESFDEWNEKIDGTLERFEYYKTLMGSFQDMVDILGAENLGLSKEFLRDMGWAQVAAANDEIESLTGHLQDLQTEEAKAREELSKATTKEDIEYREDIISDIEDRENQIQSSILSNTTATLEQIKDLYDQAIDDTFAEFEDKIAGSFKSLEELNEAYERAQKADEEYLADYKKLYELNKLNRDIEKSIDETDSIKSKKALRELQAEIAEYEKDGVEMSQYDLEYMQKKYDLRLAEIALEEAQNAKSQVRLTRDASGNYSYTYTADQDQVDDATQKYNDALFAVQDLNETYIAEQASLIPQYMTEMVEKTREIENRTDLTDEEKQEKIKETTDYYQGLIKAAGNNIEKGMGNNISLYQSEYEAFKAFNDGKQLAWDDFTTNFSQTTLSETLGPGFETLEGLYSNLATSIGSIDDPNSLLGKIKTHTDSYKTANDITLGLIGTSTENLAKTIATAILGENGETTSISKSLGQGITDFGALATAAQTATGTDDKTGIRGNVTELAKSVFNAVYGKDGESGITKGLKDTKEQVNTLSTKASEDFTTLSTNVGDWQKKWNDEISKVIDKNEALMKGYNDLIKSLAQTYKDPENTTTNKIITENVIITKYETQGDGSGDAPGGNGNRDKDVCKKCGKNPCECKKSGVLEVGDKVWAKAGDNERIAGYSSAEETISKMSRHLTKESPHTVKDFKTVSTGRGRGSYQMVQLEDTNGRTYWARLSDLTGFDTGGYTGAWGTQGKLAMLHEKELILNKWDTENILNVVSMVRELAKSIDFNAQLTSQGLGALSIAAAANPDHKFEQEVIIRAEFPGVRDRHEIEEAFTSLVNRATQFANRY